MKVALDIDIVSTNIRTSFEDHSVISVFISILNNYPTFEGRNTLHVEALPMQCQQLM